MIRPAVLIALLLAALCTLALAATAVALLLSRPYVTYHALPPSRLPQPLPFGASPPFYAAEAETLPRIGHTSIVSDATASAGKAVEAWTTGSGISTTVSFVAGGAYTVTVGAREQYYGAGSGTHARIGLYLDGASFPSAQIVVTNAGGYRSYTVPLVVGAGRRTLRLLFTNDAFGGSSATDRNVYLDTVTLAAATPSMPPTTSPATSVPSTSVPATAAPQGSAQATTAPATAVPASPTPTPVPSSPTPPPPLPPPPTVAPAPTLVPAPAPTLAPLSGPAYYVDCTGGSDGNNGTSPSSAWQSLGKAGSASLAPGTSLLFKRGCTWTGTLSVSQSGTASQPIVVGAYGSGALPVLQSQTNGDVIVSLYGSHITVDSLDARALPPSLEAGCQNNPKGYIEGFAFRSGAQYDTVQNSRASGGYAGADVQSGAAHDQIVDDQLADNTMMNPLDTAANNDAGSFGVVLHGDDSLVAHNTITGSHACSYDYGIDGSAVEVYGGQNNVIQDNVATEDDAFSELGDARSLNNTYAYNVYTSDLANSIFINTRGAKDGYGPVYGTKVYNNSVLLPGAGAAGFVCGGGCNSQVLVMRNNIMDAAGKAGYADAPFDGDYNLYWGGQRQFTLGAHDVVADPHFVNAGSGDLHLAAGSPALGSGVGVGYTQDVAGTAVPATPDRGAYQSSTLGVHRKHGHGHGRGHEHKHGHGPKHKHEKG